jgi:Mce-associated membrane protein
MEGDAGASRLNPADTDDSSSEPHEAEQTSTETTAEGLVETEAEDESEAEVDLDTETEAEDESEAEDDLDTETDAEDVSEAEVDADTETDAETGAEDESEGGSPPVVEVNPSRLGRGWLIGITAALLVLAGGVGTGGYFALRANQESQAIARHDVEAVQAAKDCVVATQAPDVNAMTAGAQKIIDCSTGSFRSQAVLYSSLFVQAYQVANVRAQVSDMRAGAERNYDDGSVDVLVAFRVKVSNSQTQDREIGYRLRVKMAPAEGQYRIANIDQVAK